MMFLSSTSPHDLAIATFLPMVELVYGRLIEMRWECGVLAPLIRLSE
jgi:hypothetical protein